MRTIIPRSAVAKNACWMIAGRVAQMFISLIVGLLTARYLGPSNYGLINYATAYTSFFMAFCTLGINSVLVKEFVDHPEDEGRIIGSTLVMRAVSSFCSAAVIIWLVSRLEPDEPTTIVVTALCSLSLLFHIFETFNYWFQSKMRSKVTAIASLAAYTVTAAYKVVLLILGKSVEWFAFAYALDYICMGVFLIFCYIREGGNKIAFSAADSKRILSRSVHFILPGLMVSIYGYSDKFMLKSMLSDADVGYYSTATAICGMWCFVLNAIIDSMYPGIMETYKRHEMAGFEKMNRQLYAIVFYLSAFVSGVLCAFAPLVIRILYGEAFLPAAAPLRVVTWYTAFSYLGVAREAWVVCENRQKYLKYIYISAAICNIVLNFLCIPRWGATGAAFASLTTQIVVTLIVPFAIGNLRRNAVLMVDAICLKKLK